MAELPFPIVQLRLRKAREIARRGGALKDVAEAWDINVNTARAWLRRRDAKLLARLAQDRVGTPGYSDADALDRLRAIRDARAAGRLGKQIAHDLGYARASGVAEFVTRFAPDGLDAAIADLESQLATPERKSA